MWILEPQGILKCLDMFWCSSGINTCVTAYPQRYGAKRRSAASNVSPSDTWARWSTGWWYTNPGCHWGKRWEPPTSHGDCGYSAWQWCLVMLGEGWEWLVMSHDEFGSVQTGRYFTHQLQRSPGNLGINPYLLPLRMLNQCWSASNRSTCWCLSPQPPRIRC